MDNNFTTDIEDLLEKIRLNSVTMADIHRTKYSQVRQWLQYYRLQTIIISTINFIIAVYIGQNYTSIVNCLLLWLRPLLFQLKCIMFVKVSRRRNIIKQRILFIECKYI